MIGWIRSAINGERRSPAEWDALTARMRDRRRPVSPDLRAAASELSEALTEFLHHAADLASTPTATPEPEGLPAGTDWTWRPIILRGEARQQVYVAPDSGVWLTPELQLYHDCPHRALILRQALNRDLTTPCAFGLTTEIMGHGGSYVSLSITLPKDAVQGLGPDHILRMDTVMTAEREVTAYARLNIAQGPNTATMLRQLGDPISGPNTRREVEFDLGFADLTSRAIENVWIDVIFERPGMNAVTMADAVMSRHARAQI
ncbi:DUF6478 family protein [Paracoccus sp. (in: a-proteobacteria)]|uniref:DUF6478 family protein n=1 Tax=Paracoccus sp. TaxID=267 RepID=UPI0026DEB3FE|nr:DUF6478 family protein [Paracoccus sp. (in: a-proteobacteria)]MDO5647058.1 DUF6478 family protein [Paracoccus sp. (in: a-proteobacteria)]